MRASQFFCIDSEGLLALGSFCEHPAACVLCVCVVLCVVCCRALLFLLVFGCRAVPVVNAQFDGAGEGGWSVSGCHCPGSSVLLEQGSFSLDGLAPPCVNRAGCWETDPVYLFTIK